MNLGSLQFCQIGKVVRATDGAFVLDQLFVAEHEYRNAVDVSFDFAGEGFLARDTGKLVNRSMRCGGRPS